MKKIKTLHKLIGNTPLIKINYKYMNELNSVYAKAEWFNLTGSIKDRVAYTILLEALKNNDYRYGQEIVEVSSGNTAISFCAIGALLGSKVTIIMPNWLSAERYQTILSYGGSIVKVSKEDGGFTKCLELAEQYSKKNNAYYPKQFENINNLLAHKQTAEEIMKSIKKVDCVVSGIGTGGSLIGVTNECAKKNNIYCVAVEPQNSQIISGKTKGGCHKIQGISDEFIPKIVDISKINETIAIEDNEAIIMAQRLCKELGLGVGISSGANFLAGVIHNEKYSKHKTVTFFADDNKKYFTTDYSKMNLEQSARINNLELIDFEIM